MVSRIVVSGVVSLFVLACGGKVMEGSEVGPVVEEPAPKAKPQLEERSCAKPVPWTPDFGAIDVSQLGCECAAHVDCADGETCMTFPSLSSAHCVRTTDPCALVSCPGNGTCLVGHSDPALVMCHR